MVDVGILQHVRELVFFWSEMTVDLVQGFLHWIFVCRICRHVRELIVEILTQRVELEDLQGAMTR
jgi:hypothetical protein